MNCAFKFAGSPQSVLLAVGDAAILWYLQNITCHYYTERNLNSCYFQREIVRSKMKFSWRETSLTETRFLQKRVPLLSYPSDQILVVENETGLTWETSLCIRK